MRCSRAVMVCVFFGGVVVGLGQNPVKLATGARFDLWASAAVGGLDGGVVLMGGGSMNRMNWVAAADQPRGYTCTFSAPHFFWTEIEVRFTPRNDGVVELSLMGPWEQSPGGSIYRQEVLWDLVTATGATIANGSFETLVAGVPVPWYRPYGDARAESGSPLAVDGVGIAWSWHDGPWRQAIAVTGGQAVTLHLYSRARVPEGTVDNPRLSDPDSPAHQARLRFLRGVNLGNSLEAPAGQDWGQTYDAEDFARIRAEGFDHVRIPARWNDHTGPGPGFLIAESFAAEVDALVDHARNHGLAAIVNIHHFDEFTDDPAGQSEKFYRIWEQIAARYADEPDTVAFELLNEPRGAATTAVMNPIYAEAIARIRITNPDRTIFVGPGGYNSIQELAALILPADDPNLIVTVHSYDPFLFTHQGASWTGDATSTTGVTYPGPPDEPLQPTPPSSGLSWVVDWFHNYNTLPAAQNPAGTSAFANNLEIARAWSDYYGRPIHVGEFGAYIAADPDSRARFYRDMRETMDRLSLGWAMWDWKAGFRYWDADLDRPAPGLREAMFPAPNPRIGPADTLTVDAAVGKRLRVRRASDLASPPNTWSIVFDEVLTNPAFSFTDPAPPADRAFYGVEWVK